jgi:hypothetical protein
MRKIVLLVSHIQISKEYVTLKTQVNLILFIAIANKLAQHLASGVSVNGEPIIFDFYAMKRGQTTAEEAQNLTSKIKQPEKKHISTLTPCSEAPQVTSHRLMPGELK